MQKRKIQSLLTMPRHIVQPQGTVPSTEHNFPDPVHVLKNNPGQQAQN